MNWRALANRRKVARLGRDRDRRQEPDAPDRLERDCQLGLGSRGRDPEQGGLKPLHSLGRGAGRHSASSATPSWSERQPAYPAIAPSSG